MRKYTSENYIVSVYFYHNEGVPARVIVIEYLSLVLKLLVRPCLKRTVSLAVVESNTKIGPFMSNEAVS